MASSINDNFKIYALRDPLSNEIRYIGYTGKSLEERLVSHIWDGRQAGQIKFRTHTNETKNKLSNLKIGNKNPNYGKYKNKIEQIDPVTNKVINIFNGTSEAEYFTNIKYQCISAVCRNKRKLAGGFIWKYIK